MQANQADVAMYAFKYPDAHTCTLMAMYPGYIQIIHFGALHIDSHLTYMYLYESREIINIHMHLRCQCTWTSEDTETVYIHLHGSIKDRQLLIARLLQ